MKSSILTAIGIGVGLIVLAGYFINLPVLIGLRTLLLRWATILAAFALLVGVANLFMVHWRKAVGGEKGGFYSAVLVLAMVLTIIVVGFNGPTAPASIWIFDYIQVPIESSLMAVLAIILVYAAFRLLGRRLNLFSGLFVATLLLVLAGTVALPGLELPILGSARNFVSQVLATAGARGILLGVALGTIATGLRVMMGADRPYGG